MTNPRATVLHNIRQSLRRDGSLHTSLAGAIEQRLANPVEHIKPEFADELQTRFIDKAKAVNASVDLVDCIEQIPMAIDAYFHRYQLSKSALVSDDSLLNNIRWPSDLITEFRAAARDDSIAVTGAFLAVAETGTLALLSSSASPASHYFMPADHIVIIEEKQIVPHLEDVWVELRKQRKTPRGLFFITGPSKTADVEQTLQYGAHGPKRLHIIIIRD